jgi:hypothetical protein
VGIGWGFNVGPLRVGGSFRGSSMPPLWVWPILAIVAWTLEVVAGLLSLLGKAFVYVFSLDGRDETYVLLVFVVICLFKLKILALVVERSCPPDNRPGMSFHIDPNHPEEVARKARESKARQISARNKKWGKIWLRPLYVLPGSVVFAGFWKQVPLVNPDLTGFPVSATQEFFSTTLIAFASPPMWLLAFSAAIGTSMTVLIGRRLFLFLKEIIRKKIRRIVMRFAHD